MFKIGSAVKNDSVFYISALIFAFTLPLSRAAVSFFILWFVILFIVHKNYQNGWEHLKTSRSFQAMGLFIALMFTSLLWSADIHEALNQIRLYSYWIIIPILAISLKKEWLPNIITAFLGGMFISEILSYGIIFGLWSFKHATPECPTPFMSHIHYSVFLATTSILLLSRLLSNRYTWQSKLLISLFFLTSTTNLMLSSGRTGQLAFLVAILVTVIFHYRLTLKSFLLFTLLSTTLFVGAYNSIDPFQKRINAGINDVREFKKGNFDTSWGLRAVFWVVTYDIVCEHPLIGIGIGDYKSAAAQTLTKNNHNFTPETIQFCSTSHYHNQYLMILAQTGIIGFALMLWMLTELFRLKITDRELKEFSVLALTVFIVACIAEPLWILQFPIILFIFITSISLAASNTHSSAQEL